MEKLYINLPYKLKEEGKKLGALFDLEKKQWFVTDYKTKDQFILINVDVSYEKKDLAKLNGAIWNKDKKLWFTPIFNLEKIKNILNNDKIDKLLNKQKELKNDPEIVLAREIDELEKYKMSDKMCFPRNL